VRQLSDPELLRRFAGQGDEAAFHALLLRHGPMVLEVCHGVLGNEADGEDAFQATFLILARKASSIRKTASLGSWLHGVAYRTALKARTQLATRKKNEAGGQARPISEPDDLTWREVRQVLHEELSGLAVRYRAPLVACYLEGKTQDEAAAQLGLAKTTLKERLERARSMLRARLVRRGLGPAAVLVATAWPSATASACLPATLVSSTVKAAGLFAAAKTVTAAASAEVVTLAEGVMKAMFLTKIKNVLTVVLVLAAFAGGAGLLYQTQAAAQPKDSNKVAQAPKSAEKEALPADPLAPATSAFKTSPKDAKPEKKVLTPEEAIKLKPTENVTVKFKVTAVITTRGRAGNVNGPVEERLILKHGDNFVVQLRSEAVPTLRRLGLDPEKHFKGKMVQVTGRLGPGPFVNLLPPGLYRDQFQIPADLSQIEIVGEGKVAPNVVPVSPR
jgi:RNA polymerase sigma factor (sigma-70 family)